MIDEKAVDPKVLDAVAIAISGAPFVTKQSLRKAAAAILAYESAKPKEAEGWRDIASAPTPVMIGASFGLGRDYDKLVWFHAGVPTHWRPLPEPPSAMLSAAGDGR